jgi:hypothetical protein
VHGLRCAHVFVCAPPIAIAWLSEHSRDGQHRWRGVRDTDDESRVNTSPGPRQDLWPSSAEKCCEMCAESKNVIGSTERATAHLQKEVIVLRVNMRRLPLRQRHRCKKDDPHHGYGIRLRTRQQTPPVTTLHKMWTHGDDGLRWEGKQTYRSGERLQVLEIWKVQVLCRADLYWVARNQR